DIEADVAGLTFDDIRFGITDNTMLLQLPFLKDVLQLNSEDTGKLLHEIDPMTFDEDDNMIFHRFSKEQIIQYQKKIVTILQINMENSSLKNYLIVRLKAKKRK